MVYIQVKVDCLSLPMFCSKMMVKEIDGGFINLWLREAHVLSGFLFFSFFFF
jgi:hypothetical protein